MTPARLESARASAKIAWLSYALALGCVAGFFFSRAAAMEANVVVAGQREIAADYLRERPYLDLPPLLHPELSPAEAQRLREQHEAERQRRSAPPIPDRIQQREQRELEGIVATAEARIDGLPPRRWGFRADEREPATVFSHVLFHGGWLHVLANLSLLLLLGHFLENAWGSLRFGFALAASGLGAVAALALGAPAFAEPYIGTSGLLAGLLGAFALRFAFDREAAPVGALLCAGGVLLSLPLLTGGGGPIAPRLGASGAVPGAAGPVLWALGGGLGGGLGAAVLLQLVGAGRGGAVEGRPAAARAGARHPQLERALAERSAGRLREAFNLLTGLLRRDPDHLDACLALWDVANELGRPGAAVQAILRVIRDEVQRSDVDRAVGHWLELAEAGLDVDAEPALSIRMAPVLRDAGEAAAARRALRNALERVAGSDDPVVASRVARAAAELDPQTAERAAWRALRSPNLELRERQGLEELLAELQPRLEPGGSEGIDLEVTDGEGHVSDADLIAPGEGPEPRPVAPADESRAPAAAPRAIELDDSMRHLEAVFATPTEVAEDALFVEVTGGDKRRLPYERIDALAVAAVEGLGPKPVIVMDLVLNWMSLTDEPLRVIRLRSDRFDPRRLVPDREQPLDALRAFARIVLEAADATPLPDEQSVLGLPFAAFRGMEAYHRDVLMVDVEGTDRSGWSEEL